MALVSSSKKQSSGTFKKLLIAVVVLGVAAGGYLLKRELTLPAPVTVELSPDMPGVGRKTTIVVKAAELQRGVERLTVTVDGAGFAKKVLVDQLAPPVAPGTEAARELHVTVEVGKDVTPEIKPGTVTIEVIAQGRGTRLRTPDPVVVTQALEVRLDPPALASLSQFVHPAQGGAEAVVYEVGASAVKDGVAVGDWFFPGSPLPGGAPTQRFVLFAVPYDMAVREDEAKAKILLVAEDALGNRAEARFIHKFIPRPMGRDVIELKEAFMQKVVGEIYARTPELGRKESLLEDYLQLNRDLRKQNMDELFELSKKSEQKFHWSKTFIPMVNAAVKGSFADRRTYKFDGKDVDTQDHLGFDLARVERAGVQASNGGVVVLARYYGIFGNCVVIDHGYGLMTLYAHLSTIGAKEGDRVELGQEIGKTGATGLAGGDHLHFTTVLHGLPVNPIEWWDGHWIKDRIKLKLQDAVPWSPN
jgi:murein DD-endopeptidase MepM/ murein hydrolase activator NlpD